MKQFLSLVASVFFLWSLARGAGLEQTAGLDDFEDPKPWLTGDPNTDLAQHDAAVTSSTTRVKEGKRSLLFKIRVNWTKRPNEKYAKGWPMITRTFDRPRDWSKFDAVRFWVFPDTTCSLSQERVLRAGFLTPESNTVPHWYTIPNLVPNQWNSITVPLIEVLDEPTVAGIRFYVAEGWYRDGDRIDFYLDDMRLVRYTKPRIFEHGLTARIFHRGSRVRLKLTMLGPADGGGVRLRIETRGSESSKPLIVSSPLRGKRCDYDFVTPGLAAGRHPVRIDLLDAGGAVADSATDSFRSMQPGRRCYLELITFYTKPLAACDLAALARLNNSAYSGVAIPLRGSYDTGPVPPFSVLEPRLAAVRNALRIAPWPWTNLNRMIGTANDGRAHAGAPTSRRYFRAIRGMDLDNETGARKDYLDLFRNAVRAARCWKSPGIVFDPEAYNEYRVYHVRYLAERRGETPDAIIGKCRKLGEDMARIVAEEYPRCILWTLFTRLELTERLKPGSARKVLTTSSYIFLGLLEYARAHDIPLKVLCGGETLPGYCNRDVDSLAEKIARRDRLMRPWLDKYPDRLMLAGTISPFHDWRLAGGWIRKGYEKSPFRTLEDFAPLFRRLFDAYDWVWIYASSAAKTLPYSPANNTRYSGALRRALDTSADGGENLKEMP